MQQGEVVYLDGHSLTLSSLDAIVRQGCKIDLSK
jgi:hypothetical protein